MRMLGMVALLSGLSGCSLLDSIVAGGVNGGAAAAFYYDPSKIYLGRSTVTIRARDAEHYGCIGRPMLCNDFGSSMECRCMD